MAASDDFFAGRQKPKKAAKTLFSVSSLEFDFDSVRVLYLFT